MGYRSTDHTQKCPLPCSNATPIYPVLFLVLVAGIQVESKVHTASYLLSKRSQMTFCSADSSSVRQAERNKNAILMNESHRPTNPCNPSNPITRSTIFSVCSLTTLVSPCSYRCIFIGPQALVTWQNAGKVNIAFGFCVSWERRVLLLGDAHL